MGKKTLTSSKLWLKTKFAELLWDILLLFRVVFGYLIYRGYQVGDIIYLYNEILETLIMFMIHKILLVAKQ